MTSRSNITNEPEFSPLRAAIWPIHTHELKKFLPMGGMMFFILFNYTILRDTKDTLVITAPGGGAEVLPFLKGYVVLPSSILFVLLYAKLANMLSRESLFHLIVGSFVLYFGIFAFMLYPNRELIHPDPQSIDALKSSLPNFQHFFPVWGSWTYSMFYVLAELWGSVMISLLFWQFANEITRTKEAKRFYALFGLLANVSLILSGFTVRYFSNIRESLPPEVDAWGVSLNYMMGAVVLSGLAVMLIYRWMNANVLTDPRYYDQAEAANKPQKKKAKLSISESVKYLISSKYLGFIAILVLAYGVSINLVEIVWKSQLKAQFPNPNDYSAFMGGFSMMTGVVTICLIMGLKGIVGKFGWYRGAILTPVIIGLTGLVFFVCVFMKGDLTPLLAVFGATPILIAVYVGAAQNILSKGTKYSCFDPTKEMAYIPLDEELKVKGKAAVDVIGGRLGKAGGGYVSSLFLMITAGSILDIAPYLAIIAGIVTIAWFYSVGGLSRMYNKLVDSEDRKSAANLDEQQKRASKGRAA